MHKISIIIPTLGGGGAERLHVNLANDWISKDYEVEFILMQNSGDNGTLIPLLSQKINVINLNVQKIRYAFLPLTNYFKKTNRDIVICAMWPLTSICVLSWLFAGKRSKLFLSEHENLSKSYILERKVKAWILKSTIKFSYPICNGLIAVSNGVKDDLTHLGKIKKNLVKVIYNPAATGKPVFCEYPSVKEKIWSGNFDHHILSIGRLCLQKDFITLIKAFKIITKNFNAKLIILGEGPERSNLEFLVKQLNLESKISLPGFVNDVKPWLSSSDLFVLSSKWEGFGNVLVEALECGLPIVSTNCLSGPSEILENGRYGKLVPTEDPSAMALAIQQSLTAKHDHLKLMNRANFFHVDKISNEYLSYFNSKS